MRKVTVLILIAVALFIGTLFFFSSNKTKPAADLPPSPSNEVEDFENAKALLEGGKDVEALQIITLYKKTMESGSRSGKKWFDLYVQGLANTKDVSSLAFAYQLHPDSLAKNEKGALLLSQAFLISGNIDDFVTLRNMWNGKERSADKWFLLDADKLISQGKTKQALEFLKSHSFRGKQDADRLIRLALLYVQDDPKTAWEYLENAKEQDPENPEIFTYRARLLELTGRSSLAHIEYLNAQKSDRDNSAYRDQLAEFYIRNKKYPYAINAWVGELATASESSHLIKGWFWNQVTNPANIDWSKAVTRQSEYQPFLHYLFSLPKGTYWSDEAYKKIAGGKQLYRTEQAIFWLRLISLLNTGHEKEASDLLRFNPFRSYSWNPELALTLERILTFREKAVLQDDRGRSPYADTKGTPVDTLQERKGTAKLFKQIDQYTKKSATLPDGLKDLINSPEAFSAAFLAAGWAEAGLSLHRMDVIPQNFPEYVAFNVAEALKVTRGNVKALEFATQQYSSPFLNLLIASIEISEGNTKHGLKKIEALSKEQSEAGIKAASLRAEVLLEQKEYAAAKEAVLANPVFSDQLEGKELLARIAHLQQDNKTAARIYAGIADKSVEAKSFIAKQAFEEENWEQARKFTQELLQHSPNNSTLMNNLAIINEKLQAAK